MVYAYEVISPTDRDGGLIAPACCRYDRKTELSLLEAGYTIRLHGKKITKQKFVRRPEMENEELKKDVEAFLSAMADSISEFLRKIPGYTSRPSACQETLSEFAAGDLVTIGGVEFVVLEHLDGETALITKDCIGEETGFGENNNNYAESIVDNICESFAEMLEDAVGEENLVEFDVDLTSDDGLKDYGQIRRKCALITSDMYRRYVDILDQHKINEWWWLATPHSTKHHENDIWVKCVSPSGYINNDRYYYDYGVRPFCILKSHIFVSR